MNDLLGLTCTCSAGLIHACSPGMQPAEGRDSRLELADDVMSSVAQCTMSCCYAVNPWLSFGSSCVQLGCAEQHCCCCPQGLYLCIIEAYLTLLLLVHTHSTKAHLMLKLYYTNAHALLPMQAQEASPFDALFPSTSSLFCWLL